MHGILLLNKEQGISSFKAVSCVKKILNIKKVGHGGTLDPFACGVLPILLGEACKISNYILNKEKGYIFTVCFGQEREGLDCTGKILQTNNKVVSKKELTDATLVFKGSYMQTPPLYSAIKHNGKRLYKLAREGKACNIDLKSKQRRVFIKELVLKNYCKAKNQATFYALVSKGTYIRSLAFDIASYLNTVGYVGFLQRVSVAMFNIKQSITLNDLQNYKDYDIKDKLVSMLNALDDIPVINIESDVASKLSNGLIAYNFPILASNGVFKVVYNAKLVALIDNTIENGIQILRVFNY